MSTTIKYLEYFFQLPKKVFFFFLNLSFLYLHVRPIIQMCCKSSKSQVFHRWEKSLLLFFFKCLKIVLLLKWSKSLPLALDDYYSWWGLFIFIFSFSSEKGSQRKITTSRSSKESIWFVHCKDHECLEKQKKRPWGATVTTAAKKISGRKRALSPTWIQDSARPSEMFKGTNPQFSRTREFSFPVSRVCLNFPYDLSAHVGKSFWSLEEELTNWRVFEDFRISLVTGTVVLDLENPIGYWF